MAPRAAAGRVAGVIHKSLLLLGFSSTDGATAVPWGEILQLTDIRDTEPGIGRQEKIIARRAARA
jgi:hypothetical protein